MADWNPSKDPYYESLYDKTPFDFIDTYQSQEKYLQEREQRDSANRMKELQLQEAQDNLDQKESLSEALKRGGDYREAARQIYIENGDVAGLTKLDKDIVDEKYKNILADKQELENILNLPPEVAMERYNSGRLGQSGPKVTNMNDLYKANRKLQGSVAGGIFSQDPMTGEPIIHTQPQYKPDSSNGLDKSAPARYVDLMGNVQYVNERDPAERTMAQTEGWVPYSLSEAQSRKQAAADGIAQAEQEQEKNQPGTLDKLSSWFQQLGVDPTRQSPQVPNDNAKMNDAYKAKNDVIKVMRKKQSSGIAQ